MGKQTYHYQNVDPGDVFVAQPDSLHASLTRGATWTAWAVGLDCVAFEYEKPDGTYNRVIWTYEDINNDLVRKG